MAKRISLARIELEYLIVHEDDEVGNWRGKVLAAKEFRLDEVSPYDFDMSDVTYLPFGRDESFHVRVVDGDPIPLSEALKLPGNKLSTHRQT